MNFCGSTEVTEYRKETSNMDPSKRAQELRELLNHHSDLYYNQDAPVISDQEYDGLMRS